MAEPCYRKPFFAPSFKGTSLGDAVDANSEHGRRGAEGEFPFAEHTAYTDLGRRIRTYSVRTRFAKNSHVKDARAAIAACESPGPGTLVHPTRGAVQAACKSIKVSDEVLEDYGQTFLDLEFVEAAPWVNGLAIAGGALSIGGLLGAAQASFGGRFAPQRGSFLDTAPIVGAATSAAGALADALASVVGGSTASDRTTSRMLADLGNAAGDPGRMGDPAKAWGVLAGGHAAISLYGASADGKVAAFRRTANWASRRTTPTGSAGDAIDAVWTTMRLLAAAYMALAGLEDVPQTMQEGLRQYDMIAVIIDQEAALAKARCDDALFLAIRAFQADVSAAMLDRAYNRPAVRTFDFGGATHALVAAYEALGDARKSATIAQFNPSAFPFSVGPQVVAPAS